MVVGYHIIAGGLLTGAYVFKVIGFAFTQAEVPHEPRMVPKRMEWVTLTVAVLAIMLGFMAPQLLALMDLGAPFGETMS